jgi:glycosyltransferase involved in cell wall biosynthesis
LRDAIVIPGWSWNAFNAPERVALALAHLGAKVLYVENPTSILRDREPVRMREVAPGIHAVRPRHWGHRLKYVPPLEKLQARAEATQVAQFAASLGLRDPLFIYSNLAGRRDFCREMKKRYFSVLLRIDYQELGCGSRVEEGSNFSVGLSDVTLAIPCSVYHRLKAKFGAKVKLIPQAVDLSVLSPDAASLSRGAAAMASIPRPRLGYLGVAGDRLNEPLLTTLFGAHPEWHLVCVGSSPIALPNAHAVPRVGPQELAAYLHGFDVGFLPYDCHRELWLHCVPLKLFEYFAIGMPVVSVPLINLWEYGDLIYFGDTADELAKAIQLALDEPLDSPKRRKRMEVAKSHSIENLAQVLRQVLAMEVGDHAYTEDAGAPCLSGVPLS